MKRLYRCCWISRGLKQNKSPGVSLIERLTHQPYRQLVLLLACVLFVASCTSNRPFRTISPGVEGCTTSTSDGCPEHILFTRESETYPGVRIPVGIIEFDDMGALMQRKYKDALLDDIRKRAESRDLMLVVFAHGWKHNAAPDNGNLRDFQEFILKVGDIERRRCSSGSCRSREVFGLYLGWRGLSAKLPIVKELSFWNRKQRAQRVGQDGATEVLAQLRSIQKTDPVTGSSSNRDHRLILIGHSFGGALLYNATQQVLQHTASFRFRNHVPRSIADMIILVNPAFEAARMSSLHERMLTERYRKTQRPILALFTSETDRATEWAFPLGRHFSTIFNSYREDSADEQKELDVRAIGHHRPYHTHRLHVADAEAIDKGYLAAVCDWQEFQAGVRDVWDVQNGVQLTRSDWLRTDALRNTPYFNVTVTDDLVSGHNSIWGDRFRDVLYRLIAMQDSPECTG